MAGPAFSGGDDRFAAQLDTGPAQLGDCGARGVGGDASGVIEQDLHREARTHSIQCGGLHAVIGRDADDIEVSDVAGLQPGGQRRAVLGRALETALRGGVRTLEEDLVDVPGVDGGRKIRMELASLTAHDAMHRERVLEVGVLGEVGARIDVMVTGGDDEGVLPVGAPDQLGDSRGPVRAPFTGTLPPSQKSFCTSTMINARRMECPSLG